MYKLTSILFILITSLTASFNIHANTQHMLANCLMEDSVCNDTSIKRSMALRTARAYANKVKGSGAFKLFIQADSNDSVIEYSYNYFQDFEVFEGPDGRDMSYPVMRVYLITERNIAGTKKEAAKWLVSAEYNTILAINNYGLPSSNGKTIDIDAYCRGDLTEREPEELIAGCKNALYFEDIFEGINEESQTAIDKLANLTGNMQGGVNTLISEFSAEVAADVSFKEAKTITQKFGKLHIFTSNDGYLVVLRPQSDGTVKTVRVVVPPNINLPLLDNGDFIDFDTLIENAENGRYRFDHNSQRFVSLVAARTGLKSWKRLSQLLIDGWTCSQCKVTITDLPQQAN